jgi:hypothetical protein
MYWFCRKNHKMKLNRNFWILKSPGKVLNWNITYFFKGNSMLFPNNPYCFLENLGTKKKKEHENIKHKKWFYMLHFMYSCFFTQRWEPIKFLMSYSLMENFFWLEFDLNLIPYFPRYSFSIHRVILNCSIQHCNKTRKFSNI